MKTTHRSPAALAVVALAVVVALLPSRADAHCDSLDGPVVNDARAALAGSDVTPVLKWVRSEDEAMIRRVFQHALKVRQAGEEARSLADMYFFETVVRVHRASEGAPYTGLKPAGNDPGPAVRAADAALEDGAVDALVGAVTHHVAEGIRRRFAEARLAREKKDRTVESGRDFVGAYVRFVHYVEGLHNAASGRDAQHAHEAKGDSRAHKHD